MRIREGASNTSRDGVKEALESRSVKQNKRKAGRVFVRRGKGMTNEKKSRSRNLPGLTSSVHPSIVKFPASVGLY